MSTEIGDMYEEGASGCCGAAVYLSGICSDCKEHCDTVSEEDEE